MQTESTEIGHDVTMNKTKETQGIVDVSAAKQVH